MLNYPVLGLTAFRWMTKSWFFTGLYSSFDFKKHSKKMDKAKTLNRQCANQINCNRRFVVRITEDVTEKIKALNNKHLKHLK